MVGVGGLPLTVTSLCGKEEENEKERKRGKSGAGWVWRG